jgi:hypothetical protein
MFVIIVSSLNLIIDTYITDLDWQNYMDKVINAVFLMELMVKVIAMGFIMDSDTYMRDSWC